MSLLLLGAAACFGLSRAVATRRLGIGAATLCVLAGLLLVAAPPLPWQNPPLLQVGAATFDLEARLAPGELALGLALLWGASVALLALAVAIAGQVRAFGAIFAWALLAVAAALLSLAAPPLSLVAPVAWAIGSLASYGALRATGALRHREAMPRGLALGLLASTLLLVGLLAARPALAQGTLPAASIAACLLLGVLAMAGAAPFGSARDESVLVPAPLGALIYGIVAPTLALGFLLRLVAALPELPTAWAALLVGIGALGVVACGCGALGESELRPLLGWVAGAQVSAIIAATGMASPLAALAGPALLVTLALATVASAAAVAALEQNTGGDAFAGALPGPRLPLAGALWALGGAAALGLPPLWGFWGRRWLLEATLDRFPWAVPPILAGSVLMALAIVLPLARFWPARDPRQPAATPGRLGMVAGALCLAPLLVLGVAPQLAWVGWMRELPFAPETLPVSSAAQVAACAIGLVGAAFAFALARTAGTRQGARAPEETSTQLAAEALAASLYPLAWFGRPETLLRALWRGLLWLSRGLSIGIGVFEQRYYLLGVVVALLTIMLLMAQ